MSNETADFLIIAIPTFIYLAGMVLFFLAWRQACEADAILWEITRREVEARMDLPRDERGRFLPRRHLGPDSLASGDFYTVD